MTRLCKKDLHLIDQSAIVGNQGRVTERKTLITELANISPKLTDGLLSIRNVVENMGFGFSGSSHQSVVCLYLSPSSKRVNDLTSKLNLPCASFLAMRSFVYHGWM